MKKFLIATAALALTAGAASAEIAFTATARAGVATDDTVNGGEWNTFTSVNLAASASGTTDGGLEFGVSFDGTSGTGYDVGGDFDSDADTGFNDEGDLAFGNPSIYVSGGFGKVTFKKNDIDFFDDGVAAADGTGDVKYEGTFGAATIGLVSDVDAGNYSAQIGTTLGAVALTANADTVDQWNVSAAYTMGAITATATADWEDVQKLKIAYANDTMRASAKFGTDDTWEVTAGYTSGALAVDLLADDTDYVEVVGSYDLGGGMKIIGGANTNEDAYVGAEMSF
jgi:outer membrane protein OmpU